MTFREKDNREENPVPLTGVPSGAEEAVRLLLERMVQEALEKEFERHIAAGRWERSERRRGWRNGSKPRRYQTRVGTLLLRIPKDREGAFSAESF